MDVLMTELSMTRMAFTTVKDGMNYDGRGRVAVQYTHVYLAQRLDKGNLEMDVVTKKALNLA